MLAEEEKLRLELREAKNLKDVLDKLTGRIGSEIVCGTGLSYSTSAGLRMDDTVAQYVADYFGGKVIKQEATKLLIIDGNGTTHNYYTRKPADKGYSYKLIRQ